jgi:Mg2+ and Co2+ transporter CorA
VVSAFSMNVAIPWQHRPFAFWIVMTLAAISVGGLLLWWKRKKTT